MEVQESVLRQFVDYLFEKAGLISDAAIRKAEMCLQDYNHVTVAGAIRNEERWRDFLKSAPDGNSKIIGYKRKTDSRTAALVNGYNAHSLELDDGHRFAMAHLGAPIISSVLSASGDHEFGDSQLLTGIIMGYEAASRIAISIQPSHKRLGYHASGTCGTIGATVGVAFCLGMDREQMMRSISCSAGSASGSLEMQEGDSELKPYNIGHAAMAGLISAYMGLTDFAYPHDMLGGKNGFMPMFSDEVNYERLTEKKDYFEIERVYIKPYASCRHSHSAVEAAILLHEIIDIDSVEKVVVETYSLGVKGHDHTEINSVSSAKLSTPYAVALALLYGRADYSAFESLDEKARIFTGKISVIENETISRECPQKRGAIVNVIFKDGTRKAQYVDQAKGEPENPMSEEDLKCKWKGLS